MRSFDLAEHLWSDHMPKKFPRTAPEKAPDHSNLDINLNNPSAARCYDYYLGGSAHLEVDRQFAEKVLQTLPFVRDFARGNRAFLQRAVKWLSGHGIDQFLDLGSGIATVGNVHEIAQQCNPDARTLYVDFEPVAVQLVHAILDESDPHRKRTNILQADLRDYTTVLGSAITRDLIDFSRPVGLLIVATMHFIGPGDDPATLMRRYHEALDSGSYLVMSHLTADGIPEHVLAKAIELEKLYARTPAPGYARNRAEFTALFDGFDLVEPGVVWAQEWWPEDEYETPPANTATLAGVGRKP